MDKQLEEIRDFSNQKNFPGSLGNDFDRVLRRFDDLENLPAPIFLIILLLFALLPTYPDFIYTLVFFTFFLFDWAMLSFLPKYKISFGPAKPSTLLLAILRLPFIFLPQPVSIIFQLIGTGLVFYSFWIEPQRLTVTYQSLVSPKFHNGTKLRILHLGDLHMERITSRDKVLNQKIKELQPDIILFSGDILNLSYVEDPLAIEQAREIIREWQAPLGVYLVTGSEAVDLAHVFPDHHQGSPRPLAEQ